MDDTSQQVYQVRITATVIFHLFEGYSGLGFIDWCDIWLFALSSEMECVPLLPVDVFKEQQEGILYSPFSFLYLNKK